MKTRTRYAVLPLIALLMGIGGTAKADQPCSKERVKVEQKKEEVRTACGFLCASSEQKERKAKAERELVSAESELQTCNAAYQAKIQGDRKETCEKEGTHVYNPEDGSCNKKSTPPDLAPAAPAADPVATEKAECEKQGGELNSTTGFCNITKIKARAPDAPAPDGGGVPSTTAAPASDKPATQRKVAYTVICMPDVLGEFETKKEAGAKAVEEATATSRTCVVRETIENPRKGEKNNKIVFTFTGKKKEPFKDDKKEPVKDDKKSAEGPVKPSIQHDPLTEVTKGEPLKIVVKYVGFKPTLATLYVRTSGTKAYRKIVVPADKIQGGAVFWSFNKGDIKGPFDYFIVVEMGKENFSAGSSDKPFTVQMTSEKSKIHYQALCPPTTGQGPNEEVKNWNDYPTQSEFDEATKGRSNCELWKFGDTPSGEKVNPKKDNKDNKDTATSSNKSWWNDQVIEADQKHKGVRFYLTAGSQFIVTGQLDNPGRFSPFQKTWLGMGLRVASQYRVNGLFEIGWLFPGASPGFFTASEFKWDTGFAIKMSHTWSWGFLFGGQHRAGTTQFVATKKDNQGMVQDTRVVELVGGNSYGVKTYVEWRPTRHLSLLLGLHLRSSGISGTNRIAAMDAVQFGPDGSFRIYTN